MKEINSVGRINDNGDILLNMSELKSACKMMKGCKIVANFTITSPNKSEALLSYYLYYVVREFKKGLEFTGVLKNDADTELYMREISPFTNIQKINLDGSTTSNLLDVKELSNSILIEHIEFIKRFGAENLDIVIQDPK